MGALNLAAPLDAVRLADAVGGERARLEVRGGWTARRTEYPENHEVVLCADVLDDVDLLRS